MLLHQALPPGLRSCPPRPRERGRVDQRREEGRPKERGRVCIRGGERDTPGKVQLQRILRFQLMPTCVCVCVCVCVLCVQCVHTRACVCCVRAHACRYGFIYVSVSAGYLQHANEIRLKRARGGLGSMRHGEHGPCRAALQNLSTSRGRTHANPYTKLSTEPSTKPYKSC